MLATIRRLRGLAVAGSVVVMLAFSAVPVHADNSTTVNAGGTTSSFYCPTGQPAAQIVVQATRSHGTIYGNFSVYNASGTVQKYGQITGGTISKTSYQLSGAVYPQWCVVPLNNIPEAATIKGPCGRNVPIYYEDASGEHGEFTGNAVCG